MNDLEIPDIVYSILKARGFNDKDQLAFLKPDYQKGLHDPFLLKDMNKAVERIALAQANHERVVVYGDYDIDGITASAVLIEALKSLDIEATSYIPDRFEEGYGINKKALIGLKESGYDLVISVDCGITSVDEAIWAKENSLDLIITDHHTPKEIIPEAIAVINPKQKDDKYPFKDLAGVGVAFKLVQALQSGLGAPIVGQEKWLLDLVALGTVCDVVDLVGENRVLVSFGLKVMAQSRRPGIVALAAIGGIKINNIRSSDLGFILGPRMNAAGRLEHAARSLELITTKDPARANILAKELDILNLERRSNQKSILEAADKQAEQYISDPILVLASEDWSHGIVGIVASKLVEKWNKPTFVMQIMGNTTKGSARSTLGYNLVDSLSAVSHNLLKFGGHQYAAGYTLNTNSINDFRNDLISYCNEIDFVESMRQEIVADVVIDSLLIIDWDLYDNLELLQPFGKSNKEPIIKIKKLKIKKLDKIGADKRHYKMVVDDLSGNQSDAIGFGLVDKFPNLEIDDTISILINLSKNEWQNRLRLQLIIINIENE